MEFPKKLSAVVGIDQTGAVSRRGEPRPLFASVLGLREGGTVVETNLRLAHFSRADFDALLKRRSVDAPVLVVVDSALGLPQALDVPLARLLAEAAKFEFAGKRYGATTAYEFFRQFLPQETSADTFPRRRAEELANANSVFRRHPFQKNIGCGTYRVLREMAAEPQWFRVWPHESVKGAEFIVVEGYPSLLWRQLLKSRHRELTVLQDYLRREFPSAPLPRTSDDADATLMAIGGWKYWQERYFDRFPLQPVHRCEGWILGLAESAHASK